MKRVKKLLASAAVSATVGASALALAPPASAYIWWMGPCNNRVSVYVFGFGGGFCDGPPVNPAGDHYHCDWSTFHEWCGWHNNAAQPIPMPPGL